MSWAMKGEVLVLGGVVLALLLLSGMLHAPASSMKYVHAWREDDFLAELFCASAEIDVFVVEKKSFVKAMDLKKERARNDECSTAYPCDRSRLFCIPE